MKLKGAKIKKISGAGPASGTANAGPVAAQDPGKKMVRVSFKDSRGANAFTGLKFKAKVPGEGTPKDGRVTASGEILIGGVKPGKCEIEFVGLDEDEG